MNANAHQAPADGAVLAQLMATLPADLVQQAMALASQRMEITAEKLALMIIRAVNPVQDLNDRENALLHGLNVKTYRDRKGQR